LTIETEDSDGKWNPYGLDFSDNPVRDQAVSPSSPCVPSDAYSSAEPNVGGNSSSQVNDDNYFLGMGAPLQGPDLLNNSGIQDRDVDIVEKIPRTFNALHHSQLMESTQWLSTHDPQEFGSIDYGLSSWDLTEWNSTDWAKSPQQLPSFMHTDAHPLTEDLPFEKFIKDLAAQGTLFSQGPNKPNYSSRYNHLYCKS
jgi:hypothetical protein